MQQVCHLGRISYCHYVILIRKKCPNGQIIDMIFQNGFCFANKQCILFRQPIFITIKSAPLQKYVFSTSSCFLFNEFMCFRVFSNMNTTKQNRKQIFQKIFACTHIPFEFAKYNHQFKTELVSCNHAYSLKIYQKSELFQRKNCQIVVCVVFNLSTNPNFG